MPASHTSPSSVPNDGARLALDLRATPEEVMRGVESLQEFARSRGVPEKTIFALALALEECGSNIVNHALKRDPQRTFHVVIEQAGETFVMELRDDGPPFDPTAAPDRPQAQDDDLPGGWGIQLVRRNMDEVRYARAGDENILRLTRRLDPAAGGK